MRKRMMAAEEPKFMFIQPVLKSTWDSMTKEMQDAFVEGVVRGFVKHTYTAHYEGKIDGHRLLEKDDEGNDLPEYVAITGTIELRA